jgi:hypothetical protein
VASDATQPGAIPVLDLSDSQFACRDGDKHPVNLTLRASHEGPPTSLDKEVHCEEGGPLVSVDEPMIGDERMGQRSGLARDVTMVARVGSSDRGLNGVRAENARCPSGLQRTLMCIENVAQGHPVVLQSVAQLLRGETLQGAREPFRTPIDHFGRLCNGEAARPTTANDGDQARLGPHRHGDDAEAISRGGSGTTGPRARRSR